MIMYIEYKIERRGTCMSLTHLYIYNEPDMQLLDQINVDDEIDLVNLGNGKNKNVTFG